MASHDEEQAPIRPYVADGIQELDNNLPSWWVGLFAFTVIFAALYLLYMHVIGGPTINQEYEQSLARAAAAPKPTSSGGGGDEPTDLNAMIGNATSIEKGKETYAANCAPCHGKAGEGLIGPNLTDKFWLHGGKPEQVYHTIMTGVTEKGMPAWGTIVGEQKARQLTAYIKSLKDSNPPNAKAPQGTAEE